MPRSRTMAVLVAIGMLSLALPAHAVTPAATGRGADGWQARKIQDLDLLPRDRPLVKGLPGDARLAYHPRTGRVRFISGTPDQPLTEGLATVASGRRRLASDDARREARRFIDRYGQLFGLEAPGRELRVRATNRHLSTDTPLVAANASGPRESERSDATVRFAQNRGGVAVLGGEIVVQVSADGEVISAAGEVLPSNTRATTKPRISAGRARVVAAAWLARQATRSADAVAVQPEGLALYDPGIMGDPLLAGSGVRLVWRVDAQVASAADGPTVHELVLVDAQTARVISSISRIHTADRFVCDNRNVGGKDFRCRVPYARTEGQGTTGVLDVDAVYRLMGVVWDYYSRNFGRDGIDGDGSRLKATVRYCPSSSCPWRNAEWHWAIQQAVFGKGWAQADDIVAHEFSHGVLDHEAPFFYQYQSGAINESYADIFGELIDLSYSGGTDTASTRWQIGEDSPIGGFRDMEHPPRFGHADRVRSPLWHKGSSDFGGVHRNNGVGNKAAFLMADGGTFRGFQVAGIGLARTARIYYQALTTRLTSAADYVDLADALVAACADLAGTNGITVAHCKSVRDATLATQMHLLPTVLPPQGAPLCSAGKHPIDVFYDDFEKPIDTAWQAIRIVGKSTGWYYPPNPNNDADWDARWASSGKLNLYAPDRASRSDAAMKLDEALIVPAGAFLRFEHGYGFDKDAKRRYDGGIVQVKLDGGPWRGVGGLFTHGGYNGVIASGRGNPLAGQRAFTGNSRGYAAARIDLSAFTGQSLKLRFRMASDRAIGGLGWYVDDVRIYTCTNDTERPSGSVSIDAGAPTTTSAKVTLAFTSSDDSTWVTRLRVSNAGAVNANGALKAGWTIPIRDSLAWDLSDSAWGGTATRGTKRVYAQVRDAAGNWSHVFSDEIDWVATPS